MVGPLIGEKCGSISKKSMFKKLKVLAIQKSKGSLVINLPLFGEPIFPIVAWYLSSNHVWKTKSVCILMRLTE